MPNCIDCQQFDGDLKVCRSGHNDSLWGTVSQVYQMRRCVNAIVSKRLPEISGNVLEIGFGYSKRFRNIVSDIPSAIWFGIDTRFGANPKKTDISCGGAFLASVEAMPFSDSCFDVIYASQTMEHWAEPTWGRTKPTATLEGGLAEITRVLKPGGLLLVDVPMRSHGSKIFVRGDELAIRSLFKCDYWDNVDFESWGKNSEPLYRFVGEEKAYLLAIRAVRTKVVYNGVLK